MNSVNRCRKIRVVIVDHEQNSREIIKSYIDEFCENLEVLALCDSVKSAFIAIERMSPDLVFLGIEMPLGSGLDLLRMFDPVKFKVIFITAFSEYAIDAFRYSAVDFILKPVKIEELLRAIKKVEIVLKNFGPKDIPGLLEMLSNNNPTGQKIVISSTRGFKVVSSEDIIMCKADSYCTVIYLTSKVVLTSAHNLKYYENLLPDNKFMRVHYSYLINLDHVREYSNQEVIILTDSHSCPLSNVHKQDFLKIFKNSKNRKQS